MTDPLRMSFFNFNSATMHSPTHAYEYGYNEHGAHKYGNSPHLKPPSWSHGVHVNPNVTEGYAPVTVCMHGAGQRNRGEVVIPATYWMNSKANKTNLA